MRYFLGFLLIGVGWGQTFTAVKTTTLTGAAEVITIQQPTTGSKSISFNCDGCGVYVDSSVAVDLTLERNGSAATSTTLTVAKVNPQVSVSGTAQAFSGSNVGTGTTIGAYSLAGAGSLSPKLQRVAFSGNDNTQNITLRTSSITGKVNIIFVWEER